MIWFYLILLFILLEWRFLWIKRFLKLIISFLIFLSVPVYSAWKTSRYEITKLFISYWIFLSFLTVSKLLLCDKYEKKWIWEVRPLRCGRREARPVLWTCGTYASIRDIDLRPTGLKAVKTYFHKFSYPKIR